MNKLPPNIDISNVINLYIPEFFESEEEHFDLVVITNDGDLSEIHNRNILSTCKICKKIKGKVVLKICYTYQPKIKYYLVHANGMLFAVKKMSPYKLQVSHLLDDIEYFSIEDRNNSGIPQIIVFNTKKSVSIFTLSDLLMKNDNNSSKMIAPAVLKLYSHIHAMRLQIKKVEKLLREKKSLVSRMSAGYMFITNENITFDYDEELVTVFGEKCKETSKIRSFPFSFGKPWIKVCFDFWVIGFYVTNLQNKKITDLELLLMDPMLRVEKTRFYTNDGKMEPFTNLSDFKTSDFIPNHGHGYILGILKEPVFTSPTMTFICNLGFGFDKQKTEQLHVGKIEIAHTDILNSSLAAFHVDRDVTDLLAVFATSLRSGIKILKFNEDVRSHLMAILSSLKFNKINDIYYVVDSWKLFTFRGCLLKIMPQENFCLISFYTRNFQDLCLYIQQFKQIPPNLITMNNTNVNIRTIFTSLFSEIKYFNKLFLHKKETSTYCSETALIPLEVLKINELTNLEENTEYNFSFLKRCGSVRNISDV